MNQHVLSKFPGEIKQNRNQIEELLESEPLKFVSKRILHYSMFIVQVLASQLHFLINTNYSIGNER